jgi:putative sterol carrier protein
MSDSASARAAALAKRFGPDLPEKPGVSGTVDVAITAVADGDFHVALTFVDGRIVATAERADPSAVVTLGLAVEEARAVLDGRLTPSAAFMRGRLKTSGDKGLLLSVLAASTTPAFDSWVAAMREAARA